LAEDAWTERREYKEHTARTLAIVRRRVGSTAGLAISFSLGFMTGSGTAPGDGNGKDRGGSGGEQRGPGQGRGLAYHLVNGPLGESAIKLASAIVAGSLMKYLEDHDEEPAMPGPRANATPSPPSPPDGGPRVRA
ncbi:MAG: hypothetical protein ACREQ1_10185, partial [Woeseiaceae bacterium]